MSKDEFKAALNKELPHLDFEIQQNKDGNNTLNFMNLSIESSPFNILSEDEICKFGIKFLNAHTENMKSLYVNDVELEEPKKIEVNQTDQLLKSLESSLDIKMKNIKIYNLNDSYQIQAEQILNFLNLEPIDYNLLKENSLFKYFTTVDGLDFESEFFYEKNDAKEDMCMKIVQYLDEKYGDKLEKK